MELLRVWKTTFRGGRSGVDAVSTTFWKPVDCPVRKTPTTLRDHELIAVRRYVENVTVCRRKWLLDYFDVQLDAQSSRCCDNCFNKSDVVCGTLSDKYIPVIPFEL